MDAKLLRLFQLQIVGQCRFVLMASEDLNAEINKIGKERPNMDRIFLSLQGILNASANISKALWGQRGKNLEADRQELRDSIDTDETSPLRAPTIRNKFEHFDEKLDEWWKKSAKHHYVDFSVIDSSATSIVGMDADDKFRIYNFETSELTFWGETFSISSIIDEVIRIRTKLHEVGY